MEGTALGWDEGIELVVGDGVSLGPAEGGALVLGLAEGTLEGIWLGIMEGCEVEVGAEEGASVSFTIVAIAIDDTNPPASVTSAEPTSCVPSGDRVKCALDSEGARGSYFQ